MDHFASARRAAPSAVTAGLVLSALLLTGCSAGSAAVPASEIADRVVAHVRNTLGLVPEVDCGAGAIDVADGIEVPCEITDPETGVVSDATVRIVAPQQGEYDIDLSVQSRTS